MELNMVSVSTLKAEITIGLNKGYSKDIWSVLELKNQLAVAQVKLKENQGVLLSVKVTICDIVFLGQDEPSATISFINYPKFKIEKESFKNGVIFIAKNLMDELEQNRIVIVFDDETMMFEVDDKIDNSINL